MIKPRWLKDSIAKPDGFYSTNGEKLKSKKLSVEEILEWNEDLDTKPRIKHVIPKVEKKLSMFQKVKSRILGTH